MALWRRRDDHAWISARESQIVRGEATADLVTSGLHALLGAELVAPWVATDKSTQEDREALLAYIRDYVVSERAIVRAGETITYGY